jgi:hypothetical protein
MLPTRAHSITVIRREADSFTNIPIMQAEAGPDGMMIALLQTDVPLLEPKLEPGTYFIRWRNSYVPEPKEGDGSSGTGEKPVKPVKPVRPGGKKPDGPPPVPDAFEFVRLGGPMADPLRMETFPPVVVGPDQPVRMTPNADSGLIELRLPFPIKYKRGEAMIFSLNLKVAPEISKQLN